MKRTLLLIVFLSYCRISHTMMQQASTCRYDIALTPKELTEKMERSDEKEKKI